MSNFGSNEPINKVRRRQEMNIGLGLNPAAFSRATTGPTQAQVSGQVQSGGGSTTARDKLSKSENRRRAMQAVGLGVVGTRRVLDRAGVTKVAGAKKR